MKSGKAFIRLGLSKLKVWSFPFKLSLCKSLTLGGSFSILYYPIFFLPLEFMFFKLESYKQCFECVVTYIWMLYFLIEGRNNRKFILIHLLFGFCWDATPTWICLSIFLLEERRHTNAFWKESHIESFFCIILHLVWFLGFHYRYWDFLS